MVKIGMIGMSPGNAHPYSWSSIVNGTYDASEIIRVGYPGVADYLVANKDTLGFNNARVTHLWTQNRATSQSIARSAGIKNIVDDLSVMVSEVDAVILARDDAEHHVEMAKPFLDNGIPIFIDKPLAISRKDLLWFTEQDSKSKFLMSCSSMRYATECRALKAELATLGKIILVTAVGKKDWLKYGVHMLEAVFSLLDDPIP
ncbi:MAG: Gfo/Idh/MocA family oxidoreductase, partial [Saprospiraceae bacterium]|nr:Gfo/Idh/MocA family oxidoreductase [Saprospiraceae bacterium]